MTAFIYIRVSTREQALDGISLASQTRECLAYCAREGIELHPSATNCDSPGVFCDPGVSAWKCKLLERPGFSELWNNLQPGDEVVFFSMSRAFRSTSDFLRCYELFKEKDIHPIFVSENVDTSSASGKLWATVLAAFAEFQSSIMSERVREARAIARARKEGREYAPDGKSLSAAERRKEARERERKRQEQLRAQGIQSEALSPELQGEWMLKDRQTKPSSGNQPVGRVFGYVRVSTQQQDVLAQLEAVKANVAQFVANGYTDGGVFVDDGVSAFKNDFRNREAGSKIWDQMRAGDLIVATKLDRICRSAVDIAFTLQELQKTGVQLLIPRQVDTRTQAGRMMAHMLGVIGEMESATIRHNTMTALKLHWMENGPWNNKNQLPRWVEQYQQGDKLLWRVKFDEILEIVRAVELHKAGLSVREVSDIIQREHEAAHGIPFHVPRLGFTRHTMETRLRRRNDWEGLKVFRAYCDKQGIGWKDRIGRYFELTETAELYSVISAVNNRLLGRWIRSHEEWIKIGRQEMGLTNP